jgi:hypothetical protein
VEYIVHDEEKHFLYGSCVIAFAVTPEDDNLIVSVVETKHNERNYYGDN